MIVYLVYFPGPVPFGVRMLQYVFAAVILLANGSWEEAKVLPSLFLSTVLNVG